MGKIDMHSSETIRIAKLTAVIFVCYVHAYRDSVNFADYTLHLDIPAWFDFIQYSFSKIIAGTAVPLFFFFSAFLLYRKTFSYCENIKKKAVTLFVPYIIFNTLGISAFYLLQLIPCLGAFFSKPEFIVSGWDFKDWINAYTGCRSGYPMLYTLWFLRDLIILNIFCNIIKFLIDKFNIKFLILTGFLLLYCHAYMNNTNVLHGATSVFYWSAGAFFAINEINLQKIKIFAGKYKLYYVYTAGIIIGFLIHYYKTNYSAVFNNILPIAGCACIIAFVYNLSDGNFKNMLLKLSKYTFPIYLMHEFNLMFFRKPLSRILPNTIQFVCIEYIFCPVIIIIYCILLSVLIKKISPELYRIMFGGR